MNGVWCNGEWWEPGRGGAAWSDRGWLHGLGLFETMLAIDGGVAFGGEHWKRLMAGCGRLGWDPPWPSPVGMLETAVELLERTGLARGRARIRLGVSGGSGALADLAQGEDRKVWMTAARLDGGPGKLAVAISRWPRNERGPLAGLKCSSYAENLVALDDARRSGFGETLFFNTAGLLCEAATANVFLVSDGRVRTPSLDSGCLPGVTRGVVLSLAARIGVPCEEDRIHRAGLESADGMFLTSATRGPVPVVRCGGRELPSTEVADRVWELWSRAAAASARENPQDLTLLDGGPQLSSPA